MRAVFTFLLLLIVLQGRVTAQTINMSHDLVSLGIASQNMAPNSPSQDARPLFQAAANYAQGHAVQILTADTGAYYLLSNTQSNAVLLFANSNLTIDLAGSTLYFKGPLVPSGMQLYYCSNVTLENFQIDFVNPPYTHVQLTSVDTVNRLLHYQTLAGWPDPSIFNSLTDPYGGPIQGFWGTMFRNGSVVPGTTRTLLQAPFINNTITIADGSPWAQAATLATLQAGDTIVVYARGGNVAILAEFGSGITLSNIAVYGGQGINLIQVTNSIVDGIRVVPRPGTGLIGGVGGVNFVPLGANNHIRNSHITRTIDDAISMENNGPVSVTSQPDTRDVVVNRYVGGVHITNGTPMAFVDRTTGVETFAGNLVSQNPPDSQNSFPSSLTLTFDRDLPAVAAGTILTVGSAATRGQGSTVEDNLIEDTYGGRGLWLSGVEGVTVQRNVIRRTSNAGIIIGNSTESVVDPGDAGPPSNGVTVTDNALEATLGPQAPGDGVQINMGAVEVVTLTDPFFVFGAVPASSNVTIQNNYVADSGRSGLWVGELNGGTLQNNLVIRSSQNPTLGGTFGIPQQFAAQVTQDALVPVVMRYSSSVNEIGDTVSATSNITAPVTYGSPGTAIAAGAGSSSVALQTAVNGFAWKATSDSSWLTVTSGPLGAGNGTVQFSVSSNGTGSVRTGHITVAGETYAIAQTTGASVACNVTGDTTTTIADLQRIINEALGAPPATHDLNNDGVVNVVDIQIVIEALFGLGC